MIEHRATKKYTILTQFSMVWTSWRLDSSLCLPHENYFSYSTNYKTFIIFFLQLFLSYQLVGPYHHLTHYFYIYLFFSIQQREKTRPWRALSRFDGTLYFTQFSASRFSFSCSKGILRDGKKFFHQIFILISLSNTLDTRQCVLMA